MSERSERLSAMMREYEYLVVNLEESGTAWLVLRRLVERVVAGQLHARDFPRLARRTIAFELRRAKMIQLGWRRNHYNVWVRRAVLFCDLKGNERAV